MEWYTVIFISFYELLFWMFFGRLCIFFSTWDWSKWALFSEQGQNVGPCQCQPMLLPKTLFVNSTNNFFFSQIIKNYITCIKYAGHWRSTCYNWLVEEMQEIHPWAKWWGRQGQGWRENSWWRCAYSCSWRHLNIYQHYYFSSHLNLRYLI